MPETLKGWSAKDARTTEIGKRATCAARFFASRPSRFLWSGTGVPATLGGARRTRARRSSTRGRATSARPRWTMLLLRRCDVSAAAASAFHGARRATLLLRPRTSTARIHATAPGLRLLAFRGDLPAPLGIGPLLRTGAAAFGIDLLTPLCGAAALCIRWARTFGCTILRPLPAFFTQLSLLVGAAALRLRGLSLASSAARLLILLALLLILQPATFLALARGCQWLLSSPLRGRLRGLLLTLLLLLLLLLLLRLRLALSLLQWLRPLRLLRGTRRIVAEAALLARRERLELRATSRRCNGLRRLTYACLRAKIPVASPIAKSVKILRADHGRSWNWRSAGKNAGPHIKGAQRPPYGRGDEGWRNSGINREVPAIAQHDGLVHHDGLAHEERILLRRDDDPGKPRSAEVASTTEDPDVRLVAILHQDFIRRHRRPTDIVSTVPPLNECRSPFLTGDPGPSYFAIENPAAIMVGHPPPSSLFLIFGPIPAPVIAVDPAAQGVWPPVAGAVGRHPDCTPVGVALPATIGSQRGSEGDRNVRAWRLRLDRRKGA